MEKPQPAPSTASEGPFSSEDGSLQVDYVAEQKLVRKLDVCPHVTTIALLDPNRRG